MPTDLDLDALEKRIGGWCREAFFYVCPKNPHRIRTSHESWPESAVADVHFDDLAEHLVEYLTAAPALLARARAASALEQRVGELEAGLREACDVLASAWALITAELGADEEDEREEMRRVIRLRSLLDGTGKAGGR